MIIPMDMVDRADEAACKRDGIWRDLFSYDDRIDLVKVILKAALGDEFVIVPKEPTVEMLVAAQEEWMCVRAAEERGDFIWRAMIDCCLSKGDA